MNNVEIHPSVIAKAAAYRGSGRTLESALGCYLLGEVYGWRVLYMVNSQKHLRDMESALGVKFQEVCPEVTDLSYRNVGMRTAERIGSFWNVIRGSKSVDPDPDRALITSTTSATR